MEEVNFLLNKKGKDNQNKKEAKKGLEKEAIWTKPIRDKKIKEVVRKKKPANWFSFFKKFSSQKDEFGKNGKLSKVKDSRREVLRQIKADNETSKKKENKQEDRKRKEISDLLSQSGKDDIAKSDEDKEVTVDYRELFNREEKGKRESELIKAKDKDQKKQKDKESKLIQGKKEGLVKKMTDFLSHLFSQNKIIKASQDEEPGKSKKEEAKSEIKENEIMREKEREKIPEKQFDKTKREEKEYYSPAEESGGLNIIGANLIKDELVTFFDWKKNIILLLSFVIASCLILGIIYGALMYWEKQKKKQSEIMTQKFNELGLQIRQIEDEEREIFIFQKRLKQSAQLLEQHIYWTNFLKFLESNTIKDVYFYDFNGDVNGNYTIPAWAKDFKALAKQIKIFKALDNVKEVKVTGGGVGKADGSAGISFSLIISIDPKIFFR